MLEEINWKPSDYTVVTDWEGNVTIMRSDGASIPTDPRNKDYYEFLEVEKADEKGEIKRTTLPKPDPTVDPLTEILSRLSSIESGISSINTRLTTVEEKTSSETPK